MGRTLWLAPMLLAVAYSGCRRDHFECGVRIDDSTIARCTGPGEVCLCSEKRCARVEPACATETSTVVGYAYVFSGASERCVDPARLANVVVAGSAADVTSALCPQERLIPPRCGITNDGAALDCPANVTCLCGLTRCAVYQVSEACQTGWRPAEDPSSCLDVSGIDVTEQVEPGALCAAATPPVVCGRTSEAGAPPPTCGGEQVCVCDAKRCATPVAESVCTSRLQFVDGPRPCVSSASGQVTVEQGLCPDQRRPKRACAEDASICGDTARCDCLAGACVVSVAPSECASGARFLDDGSCADPSEVTALDQRIESGSCTPACGVLGDDGRVVGCPRGFCVCTATGGRCAETEPACRSEEAFLDDGRCVTFVEDDARQRLAAGGLCAEAEPPTPCGAPGEDGRLRRCATGQRCACEAGEGQCAEPEATCASGWRTTKARQCLVEAPAPGVALCPGAAAAVVPCGRFGPDGRIQTCADTEVCACRAGGGLCARKDVADCVTGREGVHDARCLNWSESDFLVDRRAGELCPAEAPTPSACGGSDESDCSSSCRCREGQGACVLETSTCPSGWRFEDNGTCAPIDAAATFIERGRCPAAGGSGS